MKTWYYAVEIPRWIFALVWSHALVACATLVYFVPVFTARSLPFAAAIALSFLATGVYWYLETITPLQEFRRELGFWPGRTQEEIAATRPAVTGALYRRAKKVAELFALYDAMPAGIERDAVGVDIDHAVARFQAGEIASRRRYQMNDSNWSQEWVDWHPRYVVEQSTSAPPPAAAAAVSA